MVAVCSVAVAVMVAVLVEVVITLGDAEIH